ncbi:MAG: sulfotransferase [Verrucomicrobiota bacterium]
MDLKVKIYSAMPPLLKEWMTDGYMALRSFRESRAMRSAKNVGRVVAKPRVVYLSGFPRSGTTMLKYYFGDYPGLEQTSFNPVGFFRAWNLSKGRDGILVDKSNHYIRTLPKIFEAYGRSVRVCIIIRDPRDCIASLVKYQENREVPRDERFWPYWLEVHSGFLDFVEKSELADCLWMLRYEDLVRYPVEAKTKYLEWVGLEIDSEEVSNEYTNQNPNESWDDSVHHRREVTDYALQKWNNETDYPDWAKKLLSSWKDGGETEEMMSLFGYNEEGFAARADFDGGKGTFFQPAER